MGHDASILPSFGLSCLYSTLQAGKIAKVGAVRAEEHNLAAGHSNGGGASNLLVVRVVDVRRAVTSSTLSLLLPLPSAAGR